MGLKNQRWWLAGAILWGFAEATAFFIVPDILFAFAMLVFGWRVAISHAGAAALGAVIGGVLMLRWGAASPEAARAFVSSVPLVGDDLLIRIRTEVAAHWPFHLAAGAISGAPYKIYAVEAGAAGVNLFAFAAVSMPVRLARFALTMGLAAGGKAMLAHFGKARLAPWVIGGVWVFIYGAYIAIRLTAGT